MLGAGLTPIMNYGSLKLQKEVMPPVLSGRRARRVIDLAHRVCRREVHLPGYL
jgi:hypothetical protein